MADFVGFLKKVAPWIGAAATGNVPALITMAAQTVGGVVGKDVKPTTDAIAAAVAGATPDQLIAMKQADNDFALKMQAAGFAHEEEISKMQYDDVANARNREIQVKDTTPAVGFYIITVGFFGILVSLLKWSPPASSRDVLNIMLGSLGTAWITAVAYYYGSSAGSAAKDATINKQAGK